VEYQVDFRAAALHDLRGFTPGVSARVILKIQAMTHDLAGDVKRLRNFGIGYRLRVGDFRVLFDLSGDMIIVRRVVHRSKAYE
jgi:mRNA interferase RelE/StbE